jgi:hypothetical protein
VVPALEAAEYRALVRAQMIDPNLDVAGGFPLADVMSATALTGIDDHSRVCVRQGDDRERIRSVCDGMRAAPSMARIVGEGVAQSDAPRGQRVTLQHT